MTHLYQKDSPEYERAFLGCLLEPNEQSMIGDCLSENPDAESYFYDTRNTCIFKAIKRLYVASSPVTTVTVEQALRETGDLERVGGRNYLSTCVEEAPSPLNYPHYAEKLKELQGRRRLIGLVELIKREAESDRPWAEVQIEAETRILSLSLNAVTDHNHDIQTLSVQVLKDAEARLEHEGTLSGLSTGFHGIDSLTDGLQPGELFIIAGRPGSGKTALAMNVAEYVAVDCKIPVGVFSLEMTAKAIMNRLACSRARVDSKDVKSGNSKPADLKQFKNAANAIGSCPLYINDGTTMTIDQMQSQARRWKSRHGVKLIVVDYVQLIAGGGFKENRTAEVGRISKGLKAMAKEIGVPVLALSQLNRDCEKNQREPELHDLRESGSIEQDADLVGLLYAAPDPEKRKPDPRPYILKVDKNRNGPTGDVALVFHKTFTRFESEPL